MQKKSIPFIKMQGAGNDFIVIDNRKGRFSLQALTEYTPVLCHRKYGVGADGLLALQQPDQPGLDYTMIYRNADGSDAGMCGNGARCLALFASRLASKDTLEFNVHDHIYTAQVQNQQEVSVSFPGNITVTELHDDDQAPLYQIYAGTEHIVRQVAEPTLKNEKQLIVEGRRLRRHTLFRPKGTNVNFICGTDVQELSLQTYERGVEDLTLACGTGAIASALAWHHIQELNSVDNAYTVKTGGGTLNVHFSFTPETASYSNIRLEGPAHYVFEGSFYM